MKKIISFILMIAIMITLLPCENIFAASTIVYKDASAGKLSVDGAKLIDESGEQIQLRGISTHGIAWFPQYVNNTLFKELHDDWGSNVIRLSMYTAEYNGYCTGDKANRTALKKLVKKGIKYATANNMYVIIDWHVLNDANPNKYKKSAKSFFTWAAKTFAGYDNVIYEICNEPNSGTSWSEIKSYANYVIPSIRKYSDGVILVGTPTWSQEIDKAASDPLTGYDNIMYTMHFYAGTHGSSYRQTLIDAVNAGLPVFVSEFGICDASGNGGINKSEANKWIKTLDKYGISYVNWSLCNKAESASAIKSSISKASGFSKSNLTTSGKWLYDLLRNRK